MDLNHLKAKLEDELNKFDESLLLQKKRRQRKLLFYLLRTIGAFLLYYNFWHVSWVPWTLILYIPINLTGLLLVFGWKYFVNRKINKIRNQVEEIEKTVKTVTDKFSS